MEDYILVRCDGWKLRGLASRQEIESHYAIVSEEGGLLTCGNDDIEAIAIPVAKKLRRVWRQL